jgi:hypothetical protein
MLSPCRYIDTFGTIIVSCAPGIYGWWLKIFSQSKLYFSIRSMSLLRPRNSSAASRNYCSKEGENVPIGSHQEQSQYKLPEIVTSSSQRLVHEGSQRDDRNAIPISTVITQTVSDRGDSYEDSYRMQEYSWQPIEVRSSRKNDSRYA